MKLRWLFFSFRGRVPRSRYWLAFVVLGVVAFLNISVLEPEFFTWVPDGVAAWAADNEVLVGALSLVVSAITLWAWLAVLVKRWHDCNLSGWWVLSSLVPIVGPIWALIVNGFIPGTTGPNRFGPDPRGVTFPPYGVRARGTPILPDLHKRKQCPHCGDFIRVGPARCEWCGADLAPGWHHAMP